MAFSQLSGKMGRQYVARGRSGTVIRARPTYRQASHPATQAAQGRLRGANAAWNTLSAAQADAWGRYAGTITLTDGVTGVHYSPSPKNAFVGLATRWLQVHPGGSVPLGPPAGPFAGDDVAVAVAGAGGLTFTAGGPNRAGVMTELMAQPLKNERCSPTGRFKSRGFVAFTEGRLVQSLGLRAGWYAVAYRFVDASTGQSGPVVPLGKAWAGPDG